MNGPQIAIALVAAAGLTAGAPRLPNQPMEPVPPTARALPLADHFLVPSSALEIVAHGDEADSMYDVLAALGASGDLNFTLSVQALAAADKCSKRPRRCPCHS